MHFAAASVLMAIFEAAGVEFANGDQPGVRLAKVAPTHSVEPAKTVAPKTTRGKTVKVTKKKR
jgi:hypothetical protein